MVSRAKALLRRSIGRNRRLGAVKALHGVASFIESAYHNEGSSFDLNGERHVIECLSVANFRVVFDVGANHGDWLLFALVAWPQSHIHAFEVAPPTFERLHDRVADSNYVSRATLNCLGLSDREGSHEMFYFPEHPELTCDLSRHETYKSVPFAAHLCTGESYASLKRIEAVDFVKIDVEGAEYHVLMGLGRYLSAQKIHCLQFEYGAFSTQTRVLLADYYSLLSPNYWVGKIFPGYVEFREYDWTMEDFRFANYCCVSKARSDLRDLLSSGNE